MKLLVLASTYPRWRNDHEPGFVHELAKRLVRDFDVTVLCPHTAGAQKEEIMDGVRVVRFRYAPPKLELLVNDGGIVNNLITRPWLWFVVPLFFIFQLCALLRMNRSLKPDVLHVHWIIPQGLTVAIARMLGSQIPAYLLTSHGGDLFALRGNFFKWLKLFAVSKASILTVVSKAMREKAVTLGIPRENIQVRSMGIDLRARFVPSPDANQSRRQSVLFVGRLVAKKGVDVLIRSIPQVREAFPEVMFDIIGFGPEEKNLKALAETASVAEAVCFLGSKTQSEIVPYYQNAAVLAVPFVSAASGDEDGLGLVIAEALASGCPVVTSDLPATADIVGGLKGAKVTVSGCPDKLADALIEVLQNQSEYRRRVLNERPIIVSRVDWESVASDYSLILKSLATSHAS